MFDRKIFFSKDFRSISEQTGWISTENRFLLREEIISLRKKFSHIYDDLSILLNRNQTLENSLREQKQQMKYFPITIRNRSFF